MEVRGSSLAHRVVSLDKDLSQAFCDPYRRPLKNTQIRHVMSFNDIKQEPNIIIESFYLIVVFKSIVINLKFFAEP